jgi:hypothetical protein
MVRRRTTPAVLIPARPRSNETLMEIKYGDGLALSSVEEIGMPPGLEIR